MKALKTIFHKRKVLIMSPLFTSSRLFSYRRASRYKSQRVWIFVPFCLICATLYLIYYSVYFGTEFLVFEDEHTGNVRIDLSKNYFYIRGMISQRKFLVNNDKCQIPDISLHEAGVSPLVKRLPPFDCEHARVNLTYVRNQSVIINEETLRKMGYRQLSDISCCYRAIHRVEQSETNFNKEADNQFRFSKTCRPMKKKTRPHSSFIAVSCKRSSSFLHKIIYTNFHLIARFPNEKYAKYDHIARKVFFWRNCTNATNRHNGSLCKRGRPPNVLLLGIDSTSRLNFHRQMPRTTKTLKQKLGAIEMNGYTKVGENTFPNFVPLMTSYSEEELKTICYPNRWIPQDKCPYLWKQFGAQQYLTAHLEDSPKMAIFNYMKTGFIRSPVDFYLRPWMWAAYNDHGNSWTLDCIGYQRPEQIILNYAVDLAELSDSKGVPFFITSWLTDISHEDMNSVQLLDRVLERTVLRLKEKGLLENTLLFVMSDHGYRFADVRATHSGWYEDKLPAMFIKLPDKLARQQPSLLRGLEHNSKQLTTPFDIHATLKKVLNYSSSDYTNTGAKTPTKSQNIPRSSSRLRGLTLFERLPERSCNEAGVPSHYCACSSPVPYSKNLTFIRQGAEAVTHHINSGLPTACSPLKVDSIIASAILQESHNEKVSPSSSVSSTASRPNNTELIIALTTKPGLFRYEAMVTFNKTADRFKVSNILRTNKKEVETRCLSDKQVSFELYCYCKHNHWMPFA